MKKLVKNILLTMMLIVSMIIFPNMVDAATFKDENRTYTIEELLIDCPSAIDYSHIDEKNNFLFSNREADDNYHKLNDKGILKQAKIALAISQRGRKTILHCK